MVQYVGSGDATTCVIVALRCARTRRTAVAHLDGADPGQLWGRGGSSTAAKSKQTRAAAVTPAVPAAAAAADGQRCTSVLGLLNAFSADDIAESVINCTRGGHAVGATAFFRPCLYLRCSLARRMRAARRGATLAPQTG